MSQFVKMKEKMLSAKPHKDVMPNELRAFMLKAGFVLDRVKGSHYIYSHKKLPNDLTIPMHNQPVKPVYIRLVREKLLELEG
ncbi:MAG: type II toxin-antitoxin system HicA family toxin [Spirochaetaceae bacterium]|nr:type II toxin-antitoxin system HicA family toxin [Spirochaetaceae bacterium]